MCNNIQEQIIKLLVNNGIGVINHDVQNPTTNIIRMYWRNKNINKYWGAASVHLEYNIQKKILSFDIEGKSLINSKTERLLSDLPLWTTTTRSNGFDTSTNSFLIHYEIKQFDSNVTAEEVVEFINNFIDTDFHKIEAAFILGEM